VNAHMATSTRGIIDVNLLPRDQRPRDVAPLAIAIGVAVILAIAVLVPLGVRAHDARSHPDAAEHAPTQSDAGLHALQVRIAGQRGLEAQLVESQAQLAALRTEQAHLQGGGRPLVDDLAQLWGWGYAPAGTLITSVSGTDRGFRVDGTSPDALAAIAFADALAKRGGFAMARTASFTPGGNGGGQFSIEVVR
jgi:hypothetical protein